MGASGLGSLLVKEGLLSEQDRQTIARTCGQRSWAFAKSILATGMLDEDELAAFFAENTKFEVAPRGFIQHIDRELLDKLDGRMIARLEVLPIQVDWEYIHVAVVDPLDKSTISQLEFFTGLKVIPVIAPISEIYRGIQKLVPEFRPHFNALSSFMDNHASNAWQKQRLDGRFANSSEITNEFQKIQHAVNQSSGSIKGNRKNQIDGQTLDNQSPRLNANHDDIDDSISGLLDEDIDLDVITEDAETTGHIDDIADHEAIDEAESFGDEYENDTFDMNETAEKEDITSEINAASDEPEEESGEILAETEDDVDATQDQTNSESEGDSAPLTIDNAEKDEDLDTDLDESNLKMAGADSELDGAVNAQDIVESKDNSKIDLDEEDDQIDLVNFQKYTESPTKNAPYVDKQKVGDPKDKSPAYSDHPDISQLSSIINQALVKLSLVANIDSAIDAMVTGLRKIASKGSIVSSQDNENFEILGSWHEEKSSAFTNIEDAEKTAILEFCKTTNTNGRGSLEDNILGYTEYYSFNGEQGSNIQLFVTMPDQLLANENINPMVDDLLGRLERILSQHRGSEKAG